MVFAPAAPSRGLSSGGPATGSGPEPVLPRPNLPALKPTLDPDGQISLATLINTGRICQHMTGEAP
jgi:hypothetical protein